MGTDRCSTCGFLMLLSHIYPENKLALLFLAMLDYSSHWFQMKEAETRHHKEVPTDRNCVVRVFYNVYIFFGYCCVGAEFFYILLYALHPNHAGNASMSIGPLTITLYQVCWYGMFPGCAAKQVVNVAQLCGAAGALAHKDVNPDVA